MSNNIIGIETNPNLIPAECSFNGSDKATNKFFIRVINPGLYTDTLLMSETFIHDLATAAGYVRKNDAIKATEELRGAIKNADITLDTAATQLSHLRAVVSDLETIDVRLNELRKLLEQSKAFASRKQRTDKESAESTGESQLAGVQSSGDASDAAQG